MIGRLKALAIGFVIGVFVAPRSGRASRQLLLERLGEFFDEGSRRLEELEDELVGHRRGPSRETSVVDELEPFPDDQEI
ncbi:MAG TPA: YtxH domain-containing protein [Gemmatimonadota bacterium]|nr:YtxH domain-containing protein [Gemmatimonadota bacterium]